MSDLTRETTQHLLLPTELMNRLRTEAIRVGEPMERLVEQLLDERVRPDHTLESKLELIAQWKQEAEQMEEAEANSNEAVLRAIDANRPSYRKLFGAILDGQAE